MQSVFFILEFLLVPYDLRVISSWKFIQSSSLLWRFDFSNCGMKMLILESVMTMGMWKWMWTLWMLEEDEETYLIETHQQSIYAHIMDNSWHLCKLISLIDRDNLGFGGENVLALNSLATAVPCLIHFSSPIMGHNWTQDLARSCFILYRNIMNSELQVSF